jgi:hypothetical protein
VTEPKTTIDVPELRCGGSARAKADLALRPLVYPLMPGLRRSAVYVVAGVAAIAAIRVWLLRDLLPPQRMADRANGCIFCAFLALGAAATWRFCLRVDALGISRRRVIGWDLWPWEAFEQARVFDFEGDFNSYRLSEKPFWARRRHSTKATPLPTKHIPISSSRRPNTKRRPRPA